MWAAANAGIYFFSSLSGEKFEPQPPQSEDYHFHDVVEASDGTLWVTRHHRESTLAGEVLRWDGASWHLLTPNVKPGEGWKLLGEDATGSMLMRQHEKVFRWKDGSMQLAFPYRWMIPNPPDENVSAAPDASISRENIIRAPNEKEEQDPREDKNAAEL